MKVIVKHNDKYYLEVIPRFYFVNNLNVIIREPITNEIASIETEAIIESGLISIDLKDFIPSNDVKYSVVVKQLTNDSEMIIWNGQALYTEKDRQNYSLNNSDENKLRF